MTTYGYPDYESDRAIVPEVVGRIEDVSRRLSKLVEDLEGIDVRAQDADGDVILSVNYSGQLTSLSIEHGCTRRYTHTRLAEVFNDTLAAAVAAAGEEAAEITGDDDELASAVEALADPESSVWDSRR